MKVKDTIKKPYGICPASMTIWNADQTYNKKGMEKYLKNMALLSKRYVYRLIAAKSYTRPWAIMALDTLRKAATLAPETKSSALLPYSAAAEDMF